MVVTRRWSGGGVTVSDLAGVILMMFMGFVNILKTSKPNPLEVFW